MIATARHIRISPKKANLVAELVRKKSVKEALDILRFTPKKAAPILAKVIKSAASNAEHNFKQNLDSLVIKEIIVTKGATLKRSVPISRGRMHPINKFASHIKVLVGAEEQTEEPKKATTPAKNQKEEAPKAKSEPKKTTTKSKKS